MGCQTSGRSYSSENLFISQQEEALGFGKHSPSRLEAVFYRLMKDGLMSETSFAALKTDLELSDRTNRLLKKVTSSPGAYEGRKLLLYALLLADPGQDSRKAAALWNVYEDGKTISEEKLNELITDIASLSLVLPLDFCEPNEDVAEAQLKSYFEASTTKLPKAVSNLKKAFLVSEGRVAKTAFLEVVTNKTAPISSTRTVRKYIEETKAMPQRFAAAFKAETGFQTKLQ